MFLLHLKKKSQNKWGGEGGRQVDERIDIEYLIRIRSHIIIFFFYFTYGSKSYTDSDFWWVPFPQ